MSESSLTITGNITKAPTLHTTQSGKNVTKLRIASTRSRRTDDGWVDGETLYIDVDCWERLSQNVINSLHMGDRVLVHGRMRNDEWVDDNGNKRVTTKINADAIGPDLKFARVKVTRNAKNGASRSDAAVGNGGNGPNAGNGANASNGGNGANAGSAANESNHFAEAGPTDYAMQDPVKDDGPDMPYESAVVDDVERTDGEVTATAS
ncbi:single-stranded DNA-binding protein [uncultured Corynebacterium sp.]|uniref:single-stranded DNA-binding protein n=1 Tax=uncultured Corynebacterium sp. TaxID=159447 RepID=UPI0025EF8AA4|nr:single-stranded DNA-binding protein [uncultured Corynebacterium sp.]